MGALFQGAAQEAVLTPATWQPRNDGHPIHGGFMRRALRLALALSMLPVLPAVAHPLAPAADKQDDGRLDPAWFGPDAKLAPGLQLDFVWMKPGLSLKGKHVQMLP